MCSVVSAAARSRALVQEFITCTTRREGGPQLTREEHDIFRLLFNGPGCEYTSIRSIVKAHLAIVAQVVYTLASGT